MKDVKYQKIIETSENAFVEYSERRQLHPKPREKTSTNERKIGDEIMKHCSKREKHKKSGEKVKKKTCQSFKP